MLIIKASLETWGCGSRGSVFEGDSNRILTVPLPGLEPGTLCLGGRCSIQLSYKGLCQN